MPAPHLVLSTDHPGSEGRPWEKNLTHWDVCFCRMSLTLGRVHSACRPAAFMPVSFSLQLKLEDRSVVPRDVVRHMRSTVSLSSPSHPESSACLLPLLPGWGGRGSWDCLGGVCHGSLAGYFLPPLGQSVWHGDRRQHRLCCQANWHQLHHLPCQQQGSPAHLGEWLWSWPYDICAAPAKRSPARSVR